MATKIADLPSAIKSVWRNRVVLADDETRSRAFSANPVKHGFWREKDVYFFAIGSAERIKQHDRLNEGVGSPAPGFFPSEDVPEKALFNFRNSRQAGLANLAIEFPAPGSVGPVTSVLIQDCKFRLPTAHGRFEWSVDTLLIGRLGPGFDLEAMADDFDFLLARRMSPFVERVEG